MCQGRPIGAWQVQGVPLPDATILGIMGLSHRDAVHLRAIVSLPLPPLARTAGRVPLSRSFLSQTSAGTRRLCLPTAVAMVEAEYWRVFTPIIRVAAASRVVESPIDIIAAFVLLWKQRLWAHARQVLRRQGLGEF